MKEIILQQESPVIEKSIEQRVMILAKRMESMGKLPLAKTICASAEILAKLDNAKKS